MKVKCPKCGGFDKAPDEYTGKKIRCPGCAWEYPAAPWTMPPAARGKARQAWTNLILAVLWPCIVVGGVILVVAGTVWLEMGGGTADIMGALMVLIIVVGLPIISIWFFVSIIRWIFRVDEKTEYLRKIAERDTDRRP